MRNMTTQTATTSKSVWAGRTVSILVVLFLLFDGVIKLMAIAPVVESFTQLGYPTGLARGIGIVVLVCAVLYAIPRTAVLGAILLTGLLGGAMASHLRLGSPLFTHVLFGFYLGAMAWGGLWLRDERLRAFIPLRRAAHRALSPPRSAPSLAPISARAAPRI